MTSIVFMIRQNALTRLTEAVSRLDPHQRRTALVVGTGGIGSANSPSSPVGRIHIPRCSGSCRGTPG